MAGPFSTDFSAAFGISGALGPFTDDFSPAFGNGVFLASGRAAARGTGAPQFNISQPGTQVHASGFANTNRGRATVAAYVVSVAARGLSFPRSQAGGVSQFPLGLKGTAQSRGTIIDQAIAQVSARGNAIPRGFVKRATGVSARGFARPSSAAGVAALGGGAISLATRGTAAARGRATKALALMTLRGFATSRGRAGATARPILLAARGMAKPRGTARDTIQAQQIIIPGAPPPLTIWQRLSTVTPAHEMHEKPRVLRQQFGDGYGQTVPDGLTPIVRTLTLTWENVDKTEADNMIRFLQDYIGVPISFVAPRDNSPRKWLAKDWRRTSPQPNADNITVTFEDRPYVELILGL